MAGNNTRPQQRLDRETTSSAHVLQQATSEARQLVGSSNRQIAEVKVAAAEAQASADDAKNTADGVGTDATKAIDDAADAQAAADAAQSTANTALANSATAQSTADSKLALLTDSAISTDADETFTATVSNSLVFHTGTLTASRTITLAAATDKWQARFVRTGVDIFMLDIGGLKSLVTGTWCDVYYNGSAWVLTAYGTL